MTSIVKPKVAHPGLAHNELGLTRRDYEGAMSTLCAGCRHDSITASIIEACWRLSIDPSRLAKLSGIGCSSKTTAYFASAAHGFNAVHGRMPAIATGANAANHSLHYIGVSGDGDSLSIGLGQLAHLIRRNIRMLYLIENNGVYGLTKGQFSASADVGSRAKRGEANRQPPIDPVLLALTLGATFVARSFSGDKEQLVPLLQAGLRHKGLALIDVLSPCVTFNDHEGSTRSYAYAREHYPPSAQTDFVLGAEPISASYAPGETITVPMHEGGALKLYKADADHDPTDRAAAYAYVKNHLAREEHVTGLIFADEGRDDEFHALNATSAIPLCELPYAALNPGREALASLMKRYR